MSPGYLPQAKLAVWGARFRQRFRDAWRASPRQSNSVGRRTISERRALLGRLRRARRFANGLNRCFKPPSGMSALLSDDTIVLSLRGRDGRRDQDADREGDGHRPRRQALDPRRNGAMPGTCLRLVRGPAGCHRNGKRHGGDRIQPASTAASSGNRCVSSANPSRATAPGQVATGAPATARDRETDGC